MAAAMPSKRKVRLSNTKVVAEEIASPKVSKTVHGCMVESHESSKATSGSSPPAKHEDHIAGKGPLSMTHHNLLHNFILRHQAMNMSDAKVVVDKEWKNRDNSSMESGKIKSKKEVILEARRDKKKVHATLMDICHFKNAE